MGTRQIKPKDQKGIKFAALLAGARRKLKAVALKSNRKFAQENTGVKKRVT